MYYDFLEDKETINSLDFLVEGKYPSLATTSKELLWVSYVLKDLCVDIQSSNSLFCDNKYAIMIANNPCQRVGTKHIEIDVHFT